MFFDKYSELCRKKGKTPTGVAIELNVSRATVNYWKNGNVPKQDTLIKIANYFGVSVDYLLGNETDFKSKTESVISDDDIKFALWGDVADEIPNDKLQEVKTFAEFIKNTYKKDNNK